MTQPPLSYRVFSECDLSTLTPCRGGYSTLYTQYLFRNLNSYAIYIAFHMIKDVIMREMEKARGITATVSSGSFRSVQWSGWCAVRELDDGGRDPAPGIRALVIAGDGELVNTRVAYVERFLAAALDHQIGGSPDIDLGCHAQKMAGLPSRNV
jgi:hypothetical protein